MSVQGQLSIALSRQYSNIHTTIDSSRPLHAAQIFSGKPIAEALQLIPLLFSVCGKAQAVTCINAVESAICAPANQDVQSQREALVLIESLREHSLRILIDWPKFIKQDVEHSELANTIQSLNKLMQMLEPQQLLSLDAVANSLSVEVIGQWHHCQQQLTKIVFGMPIEDWLAMNDIGLENWSEQSNTQPAGFIWWLMQQQWKYAGYSDISPLPQINDVDLLSRLQKDNNRFIAQPNWYSRCYELSWFNYQSASPFTLDLIEKWGNGIYTRMIARLRELAELIEKLDAFFHLQNALTISKSTIAGLAHTNAARGRLSHYIEIEDQYIKQLCIVAPTEWNFHPEGVAADSLCHLNAEQPDTLRLQAELLIHAIDPCVEYQLQIENEVRH